MKAPMFIVAAVLVLAACSDMPTQHSENSIWGSGIYSGIMAAPISYLTINLDAHTVGMGKRESGEFVLKGSINKAKSSIDTIYADITETGDRIGMQWWVVRFKIDNIDKIGMDGQYLPFGFDPVPFTLRRK